MASQIAADVQELKELDTELKRLRKDVARIRSLKESCEQRILEYIETNDQPGVRFKDITIVAESRTTRRPTKKSERLERGQQFLQRYGVHNSERALEELMEEMRGEPEPVSKLRFL